ncbi:endonuclease/exonuclease/phosphatase family protein [Candidatus Binatia bacterium]|nr:endonuclease/exonuclease/phosphatase family protein [Candidatus Binatia bacterium]
MAVELRLLSWNVHGVPGTRDRPQRLDRVADEVLRRDPDLVLLQEVWLDPDRSRLVERLAGAYVAIDVRPQGWLGRPGGLLACVRREGMWRTCDSSFRPYRFAAARWRVWEGDGIGRKGLQRIDFDVAGERVVVLNTHLQASYPWNHHGHVRGRQLLELQSIVTGIAEHAAVVVAGDLNTRPGDREYRHIRAAWVDLTAELRARDGCGTCLEGDGSDAGWLDYVLTRRHPAWQVTAPAAERIVNEGPDAPYSDHHGLAVTLRLARGGAS